MEALDDEDLRLFHSTRQVRSDDVFTFRDENTAQWPRRLLYVPEMHSYLRKEGQIYRDEQHPHYNILTYTWGRWRRPCGKGQAISVGGVSWQIPAVDPDIFSAESFESILKRVAQGVDWVWVDVACINQEDPIEGDDEIGRQTGIFSNADEVFVWLHHSPISSLQLFFDRLLRLADRAEALDMSMAEFEYASDSEASPTSDIFTPYLLLDEDWRHHVMVSLDILDEEPWFSSLWTLQESFLRPSATILSKEGKTPSRTGYAGVYYFNLLRAWGSIHDTISKGLRDYADGIPPGVVTSLGHILRRMERLGLRAVDNPVVLYPAASHRTTTREDDRIYGIMQVFGLRLGKSAMPGTNYSLAELEIQFADALNSKSPIWAQLFVHTSPKPPGRHWCISQTSQIPERLSFDCIFPQTESTIGVDPDSGNPMFTGDACSFAQLGTVWSEGRLPRPNAAYSVWGASNRDKLGAGREGYPVETIILDRGDFAERYIPTHLRRIDDELSDANNELRSLLLRDHGNSLEVFLLGKLHSVAGELETQDLDDENPYGTGESDAWIGMIVHPVNRPHETSWQRIGLAIWSWIPALDEGTVEWRRTTARLD
ncbi:MAG: hypothetical protein Q9168_004705 [Polycauliona sp. 1 TL-2023]